MNKKAKSLVKKYKKCLKSKLFDTKVIIREKGSVFQKFI